MRNLVKVLIPTIIIVAPILGIKEGLINIKSERKNPIMICNLKGSRGEQRINDVVVLKRKRADMFFKKGYLITITDNSNCKVTINTDIELASKLQAGNKTYDINVVGGNYPKLLKVN